MESGSMNHELLKFFNYDSSVPTSSAFYQQRSKLSVSAFRHLLREFNIKFPLEKFRNKYYLIACDGSEFNIARNLKIQILTMNQMVNLHLVLTWFIPSPYMRYALNVILIWKFSTDVEKMNFRPSAILWIGMPMEDTLFSSLTEDFPVTMSLLMQSKIKLILWFVQRIWMYNVFLEWILFWINSIPQWNLFLPEHNPKRSINILNEYSGAAEPLVRCGEPRNNHKFFKIRNL